MATRRRIERATVSSAQLTGTLLSATLTAVQVPSPHYTGQEFVTGGSLGTKRSCSLPQRGLPDETYVPHSDQWETKVWRYETEGLIVTGSALVVRQLLRRCRPAGSVSAQLEEFGPLRLNFPASE
jgi:hypothetical protein